MGENNDIYYKQVSVSKENFTNILGEDGQIKILDISGNELSTINKDTEVNEDGNIVVNFNEKYSKLSFETTAMAHLSGFLLKKKLDIVWNFFSFENTFLLSSHAAVSRPIAPP